MNNKKILEVETLHPKAVAETIEILNGVIHETTLVITEEGIQIADSDESKSIFIKLILNASKFNKFSVKYPRLEVGINLEHLNKHIKSMETSSILSIYINENDKQSLCLEGYNTKEKSVTKSEIKLMELNYKEKPPREHKFSVYIVMKSIFFHKICKEMNNISEFVEIKCSKNKFIFSCIGDSGKKEKEYNGKKEKEISNEKEEIDNENDEEENDNDNSISIRWDDKVKCKLVQGIYELKNIILFNKCTSLSTKIIIDMNNDDIICIKYIIANLGELIVALSPVDQNKITKNYNYSDDEDEISIKE